MIETSENTTERVWTLEKVLSIRKEHDIRGVIEVLTPLKQSFDVMLQSETYQRLVEELSGEDKSVLEQLATDVKVDFDNDCVINMALSYNTFAKQFNEYSAQREYAKHLTLTTAEKAFGIDDLNSHVTKKGETKK